MKLFDVLYENANMPPNLTPKQQIWWKGLNPREKNRILHNLVKGTMNKAIEDNNRLSKESDKIVNGGKKREGGGLRSGERTQ
jgi:hypothetical protein